MAFPSPLVSSGNFSFVAVAPFYCLLLLLAALAAASVIVFILCCLLRARRCARDRGAGENKMHINYNQK